MRSASVKSAVSAGSCPTDPDGINGLPRHPRLAEGRFPSFAPDPDGKGEALRSLGRWSMLDVFLVSLVNLLGEGECFC